MRILGLDPGTATTGFGVIEVIDDEFKLLDFGCITTKAHIALSSRLKQIAEDLVSIIKLWKPDCIAIEELFFSKNVKTAIHVAHARGAIMENLAQRAYEIHEYKPQEIKETVCGYGKADKSQVQKMVQLLLQMEELPRPDDAADALATAICHAQHLKTKKLFALT